MPDLNKIIRIYKFATSHTLEQNINRLKKITTMFNLKPLVSYSPTNLSINVTTVCNFKCFWCSTKNYRELIGYKYLSITQLEKLLHKFRKAYSVSFSGSGETFLNKELFNMIKLAHKHKMQTLVTTNGSLLLKRLSELLSSPLEELEISLKGYSPQEHNDTTSRPKKEFSEIILAIRTLIERRRNRKQPKIILSYVCDRYRIYNIPHIIKIGIECGVDEVAFYNIIPDRFLRNEDDCLFIDDISINNYLEKLKKMNFNIKVRLPKLYDINPTQKFCPYPFINMSIGVDGGVCGCGRALNPSLSYGNAFTDKNVFNNPYFQYLRSIFLNQTSPLLYECKYCEFNNCSK